MILNKIICWLEMDAPKLQRACSGLTFLCEFSYKSSSIRCAPIGQLAIYIFNRTCPKGRMVNLANQCWCKVENAILHLATSWAFNQNCWFKQFALPHWTWWILSTWLATIISIMNSLFWNKIKFARIIIIGRPRGGFLPVWWCEAE